MRWRTFIWAVISLLCFLGAAYFWHLGERWAAEKKAKAAPASSASQTNPARPKGLSGPSAPFELLTQPGSLNFAQSANPAPAAAQPPSPLKYRLSNTSKTVGELSRVPSAVLLENALIDTALPGSPGIPDELRSKGDPGAYIVQSRGPLDNAFRGLLAQAGASIVSYVPNNAYLVEASAEVAQRLRVDPRTQSVLSYEPYYKLKGSLLRMAVEKEALPEGAALNLLLFPGTREAVVSELDRLGVLVMGEERSPFGPVVKVAPRATTLATLAGLAGVQEMEPVHRRVQANDLSRAALGVAADSTTQTNYLALTGSNVLVNVNDGGVDDTHPDLVGRVFTDGSTNYPVGLDLSGHGTHVAGVIMGDGTQSLSVSNAEGSVTPIVEKQFRGKAPGARVFSMNFLAPDAYLQETAARTNAFISNNSWDYQNNDYDLAAASYDAAVRDSLPGVPGSQPLLYVFAAGNRGGANSYFGGPYDAGQGGNPDSILSPATAKNVITVGAIEQPRNITNEVWNCVDDGTTNNCTTNTPWLPTTDANDQVAGFSSRGNVGIGIEGDTGRFKPDVVAPGTFVMSTRSSVWDEIAYYNPLNLLQRAFTGLATPPGGLWYDSIFVPANAVFVSIEVYPNSRSPVPFPVLPIYVKQAGPPTNTAGGYDFVTSNNVVMMPPDGGPNLSPRDVNWWYGVGNDTAFPVSFDLVTRIGVSNETANLMITLSNLNETVGPYYRFESGTSISAGEVSGTLALMQQFFQDRLITNSPALMKALLINGARSVGNLYDFQVNSTLNLQGWGLVNLPNSVPGTLTNVTAQTPPTTGSMLFFDQSPSNALATGQSRTYRVQLSPDAQELQLRVTLAWTDPPANPIASIKLVNDLDLVVTNLDTGEVYFGNDIGAKADFNEPWQTNKLANIDMINNVENVYLNSTFNTALGSNYTITVVGRRVNVNAVTAHTNDVVQDYALVISSGNGEATNGLTLVSAPVFDARTEPFVSAITNMFGDSSTDRGGILMHQHVGANTPLLGTNLFDLGKANGVITAGMTNQWHFYVLTNDTDFTNAAFLTFLPPNLAVPRMGTRVDDPANATRPEADIDLYVSMNQGLTNLDTNVLLTAWKSLGSGGTETIVISNATRGIFYIGVKSEDQQSAEYSILGVVSQEPFGEDRNGNLYCRGFPLPAYIPDGTSQKPGGVQMFAIAVSPIKVHRAIVGTMVTHELYGDLVGTLTHGQDYATLNNHTTNEAVRDVRFTFDDSLERSLPVGLPPGWPVGGAQGSDGPGTLHDFAGKEGLGQWLFTMVDNSAGHIGYVSNYWVFIEKQLDPTQGITAIIEPGACREDFLDVPADATNLTVSVSILSGTGPVSVQVCPLNGTPADCVGMVISNSVGGSVTIDTLSTPPLGPGTYSIKTCNLGNDPVKVYILARLYVNPNSIAVRAPNSAGPIALLDDAVTYAGIIITNHFRITDLDIGLLIQHPRVSDLAITLISPTGTRVVLFEDRGAGSTNGLGSFSSVTNGLGLPVFGYTNLAAFYTNDFESAAVGPYAQSARFQGWTVLTNMVGVVPDLSLPWLSNNVLVVADGVVSNTLPTTNSTQYRLTFKASHAPYLVGTVGWWPMDGNGMDIFSGLDGLFLGNSVFGQGKVGQAFFGDGAATRMIVPSCPDIDVGPGRGFSVEGWIYPGTSSSDPFGAEVMRDGFENAAPEAGVLAGRLVSGWLVESGDVDVMVDGSGFIGNQADTGLQALDLNGWQAGSISRQFNTKPGTNYLVQFAFTKNPSPALPGYPNFEAVTDVSLTGYPTYQLHYSALNSYTNLNWAHTSFVFTASSPQTKLQLTSRNLNLDGGMYLDSFVVTELTGVALTAPLVQWSPATNGAVPGVQLWFSGLLSTNVPGGLWANIGDTNGQPHLVGTPPLLLTNAGWQHVALTYDAPTRVARFYINGVLEASQLASTTNFVPDTTGDLFFGYDPTSSAAGKAFFGGLDEFGLYERPLTDCEVGAIFRAGANGKYGTNVLSCPVVSQVVIHTTADFTFTFTNGLAWTNGPRWEVNTIDFSNNLFPAFTNGPGTNVTPITVKALDPNLAVDDFVLSALVTNTLNGLLHFTDNTNVALVPIKFAPSPFAMTNFPPIPMFTNDFETATSGVYYANSWVTGSFNNVFGPRDWLVTQGAVAVASNNAMNVFSTNFLVLSTGSVLTELPTSPGRRYQLSYTVRGPGAVGWWNGDVNPLDRRAFDLLGGNDGAFINRATNESPGFVAGFPRQPSASLFFEGFITNGVKGEPDIATKVELGDPENLRLTNAITIEAWIAPLTRTNVATEQLFFRGDSRPCLDPFYLSLERFNAGSSDLHLHVEDASGVGCGADLFTTNGPIYRSDSVSPTNGWQHIAAIYESRVPFRDANGRVTLTNQMRLYVDGVCVASNYTGVVPFRDLDPAYSPGIAIGNRSRQDTSQPYRGYIDELTVYGRALTDIEIAGIRNAGAAGKADFAVPPAQSLARVAVSLNGVVTDVTYGDNARWTERTFDFTAGRTNTLLGFQGLLPGTLIDRIRLVELPVELSYQPEQPLEVLNGEDAFGLWKLEIWDTRAGATNGNPTLVNWQLDFKLAPLNPTPAIYLAHGLPVTNSLPARSIQNYIVQVPQWASYATNVLLFANDRSNNPVNVGVLYDTNGFPTAPTNYLFWPPVNSGTRVLATNAGSPRLMVGQPYFLTVTNTNSFAVTLGLGVWFDINQLTNCLLSTNYAGPAGIPRYFQFDVPTNAAPPALWPKDVTFWLYGANTNLTVVMSQHLPLPDLGHFDYISRAASTNQEIVMVVTNSTPFPIQTNRWYLGVFNSAETNVPFSLQACYRTNYPIIVELTNGVPFIAQGTNAFVAPPGPPRWFFFEYRVTNSVEAVLFEMYGLSGDVDLVLQRDIVPTMAPYFDSSTRLGLLPEQIVLRPTAELPDLRGNWYLGVFNNETNNVDYTIRAVVPVANRLLRSSLPTKVTILPVAGKGPLIGWNAVEGENYVIEFAAGLKRPIIWTNLATVVATTPLATFQVPVLRTGTAFYRITQVTPPPVPPPPVTVRQIGPTQVEVSWSTAWAGLVLQYAEGESEVWYNWDAVASPIVTVGPNFITTDTIGAVPRYYRLAFPYP